MRTASLSELQVKYFIEAFLAMYKQNDNKMYYRNKLSFPGDRIYFMNGEINC
jgi:hypothetical protein